MSPTSITADDASWLDLFRGANALRVLVLAAGVALHAINLYLTTTILPSVVDDIGGVAFYAWNTTLFIVASITGAAVAAQVIQHAGPRGAYLLGAAVFGGGSALCALAPAMPVLLAGRVLQGLGGGVPGGRKRRCRNPLPRACGGDGNQELLYVIGCGKEKSFQIL